jgi:hypothetical protein
LRDRAHRNRLGEDLNTRPDTDPDANKRAVERLVSPLNEVVVQGALPAL